MEDEKTTLYDRTALNKTIVFKRTGEGGGAAANFYIEYLEASAYHLRGEVQPVMGTEAFIGRESRCLIRFDTDHFPMVSREHAVIACEPAGFKLVHLSQTNATLVNGVSVVESCFLKDGDKLQFSEDGPCVVFRLSAKGKKPVSTTGRKLHSFKAITITVAAVLLAAAAGFIAYRYFTGPARSIDKLTANVYTVRMKDFTLKSDAINNGVPFTYNFEQYGDTVVPTATGFVTDDHHFITSHHLLEPWYNKDCSTDFNIEDPLAYANLVTTKFGGSVTATFTAKSDDGQIIEFTSTECVAKPAKYDEIPLPASAKQYRRMPVRKTVSANDYVYVLRDVASNITSDPSILKELVPGDKLYIIGVPTDATAGAKKTLVKLEETLAENDVIEESLVLQHPVALQPGSPVFYRKRDQFYLIGTLVSLPNESVATIQPITE